jgi:hypothetical protein
MQSAADRRLITVRQGSSCGDESFGLVQRTRDIGERNGIRV